MIKKIIRKNHFLHNILSGIKKMLIDVKKYFLYKNQINKGKSYTKKIYYFGIPVHTNLGDLAQGICIRKWLSQHFPDYYCIEIETDVIVNTKISLISYLKKILKKNDLIIFQSGYTTTDLGGFADEMHRIVIENFPNNKMLMMPQTIFFVNPENMKRSSKIYDAASHMLFLARDKVSYAMAQKMFPHLKVLLYPDIVTTLIGKKYFTNQRKGILFCCRNDGEKYYSVIEINNLMEKCKAIGEISFTDTTIPSNGNLIIKKAEQYIYNEIEKYSRYKVIVTDRYHGTILSLVAGTPVIVLKTTDHKVITGAEWFKGIYDKYVFLAEDLEDAYNIVQSIYTKEFDYRLKPYFEKMYYDKLPTLFRCNTKKK